MPPDPHLHLLPSRSPIRSAAQYVQSAETREARARAADAAARARDGAADLRDVQLDALDLDDLRAGGRRPVTGAELLASAARSRQLAERYRAEAAAARMKNAAEERAWAARDRERAAQDRAEALTHCRALAAMVQSSVQDSLTGAFTRAPGLAELELECVRASRNGGSIVVGYLDVIGLKAVNDSAGHAAGDALLLRVVARLRSLVRPYDLIIRLGGDEFLCVMAGIDIEVARARFSASADADGAVPVRIGFARWRPPESIGATIGRADTEMLAAGGSSRADAPTRSARVASRNGSSGGAAQ